MSDITEQLESPGVADTETYRTCLRAKAEIERLRGELAGADRIANGWQQQKLELRRLLRFFFENVPVQYHERYADVMTRTEEILGPHE